MFEIIQHTADVRIRVTASTQEHLFAEALRGLTCVMKPEYEDSEIVRAHVEVTAPDTTALLVDFLNEVLTRSSIHREAYMRAVFPLMTPTALQADLEGHRVTGLGEDVKAVTYHEANVIEHNGIWSTMLVLDV